MTFTKDELQQELRGFLVSFARSMERVYGPGRGGALLGHPNSGAYDIDDSDAKLDDSWLWQAVLIMYDYGIGAVAHKSFGADGDVGNMYGEAEMFLVGIDSLEPFMREDDVEWPKLSKLTVRTAMARHILDGGERYHTREEEEHQSYLSFSEVALLADMDERSVRNAANPKLTDALVTKNFGRRTLIHIDDAGRWLAGRKGFVPTQGFTKVPEPEESKWASVSIPYPVHQRICALAAAQNTTLWDWIERTVAAQEGEAQ